MMPDILEAKPYRSTDSFTILVDGSRYLFSPLTRTYSRINADMERLLTLCDGAHTVAELIGACGLPAEATELFQTLFAKDILRVEVETDPSADQEGPLNPARPFTHLTLFPTHACNLACTYCYASGGDRPKSMSRRTAQLALDFLFEQLPAEQELVALSFHGGGEPTMAFPFIRDITVDFRDRCEESGRRSHVSMVTNGAFGSKVLDWIIGSDIGVNFSMDGSPKVQDKQRPFRDGSGSYAVVVENMRALRQAGRDVTVRATVTADSLVDMDDLVSTCLDLDVAALQAEPCFVVGRCEESGVQEPEPKEFAWRFLDAYRRGLASNMDVTYSGLRCTDTPRDRFCGACGDSVAVTPDGHLTACFEVVHESDPAASIFFVGRVDESSDRVWLNEDRLAYLRQRITPNLDGCGGCFLKFNCAGDCVVKSFRAGGSIFAQVPDRCRMADLVNRKLIAWIADGEIVPRDEQAFEQYLY